MLREDEEVAAGMIPGAKHIRMMEIPDRLNNLIAKKNILLFAVLALEVRTSVITYRIRGIK